MKITIKNLQQQTFCIDFDNTKTVKALKEAIFEVRGGEYSVDRQKLIYAGIILDDERTLASYDVSEKKFIVVMLKRDIAAATTTTTSSTKEEEVAKTAEVTTKAQENVKKSDNSEEQATSTTTTTAIVEVETPTTTMSSETLTASSGIVMGDEYQRSVNSMIEMGYSRELVERAMAASYNNPERAVEYLISGIPENSEFTGFGGTGAADVATRAAAGEDPFEFLRNQPQFLQMRSLVYQNPDLLQAVLRQIGNTNPALLQLISENQDAFLNMLNQPLDSTEAAGTATTADTGNNRRAQMEAVTRAISGGGSGGGGGGNTTASSGESTLTSDTTERRSAAGGEAAGNPQTVTLSLTANDKQAIERLKAMGFGEALVLQAYFACEKDEQLAANFLISSAFDD